MKTAPGVERRPSGGYRPAVAAALSCLFFALLIAAYAIKARTGFVIDDAVFAISLLVSQTVGLLLAVRRPDNAVGWIVCGIAWSMASQSFLDAYAALALERGWDATLALWLSGKSFLLLWAGVIALFLYFPTGHLPSPRWRLAARGAVVTIALGLAVMAVTPGPLLEGEPVSAANPMNPTGLPADLWEHVAFLNTVMLLLFAVALLISVAALIVRYRTARGIQRLQIRWVAAAATAFGFVMIVAVTVRHLVPEWLVVADVAAGLTFSLVPLSVGVAVLRFHLYEIDRVINRSVVYTILTVVLGASYLGAVSVMRAVTAPMTGDSALAVAGSTLAVAGLFRPARRRIQDEVDRRFNRARYDAAATVTRFSTRLRDEIDLDSLSAELVAVASRTMQPRTVFLWLRGTAS